MITVADSKRSFTFLRSDIADDVVIREGDKVTLPTEPGVVQVVGKDVTADTIKDALKILHSNHVSLSKINWIWIPPLPPTTTGANGSK